MAAPINNVGGRKDKHWRDALMVAIKRTDPDGRTVLSKIAQKVVEAAMEGDMQAIKEIGDRIDGKAPQSLDVTTRHEQPINELSDAELSALIATRRAGGNGVAEEKAGETKPH